MIFAVEGSYGILVKFILITYYSVARFLRGRI